MSSTETALIPLEPVPDEYRDAWVKVQASSTPAKFKRAIYRLALGSKQTEAAQAEGCSQAQLWHYAAKFKIGAGDRTQLVRNSQRIALLAQQRILDRLDNPAHDWKDKDLADLVRSNLGTVADMEGWKNSTDTGGNFISAMQAFAQQIVQSGGKLELALRVSSADHEQPETVTLNTTT